MPLSLPQQPAPLARGLRPVSGLVGLVAPSRAGEGGGCSAVDLAEARRLAITLVPEGRGGFQDQAEEVLEHMQRSLASHGGETIATVQTIFLRSQDDQALCERLIARYLGPVAPVTNFVYQPPCCGAALAIELWAIRGGAVQIERFGPQVMAVAYDGMRWIHCGGITPGSTGGAYRQTHEVLARLRQALASAGAGFEHVVRTWFYLGGITEPEPVGQRYQELNRARSDCFEGIHFCSALRPPRNGHPVFPASTGIGMGGRGLVLSCLALESSRKDLLLQPLENPGQTPAYAYGAHYSAKSPKFSRAMALVLRDYVTTWVSGTASIVASESRYPGDVEKQTEQTIDNIERLIAAGNFAAHGVERAGAELRDLAKIRVYLKRAEDWPACDAVCRRRLGAVPAVYAVADVCRPELLVEIEGVAFSPRTPRPEGR